VGLIAMSLWLTLSVTPGAAETHRAVAEQYYRTFHHRHPVFLKVRPGDTVVTKTVDTGGIDDQEARKSEPGNPLTGPFYVEGAEPGDALVVRFDRIRMNRNWGFSRYRLGLFALTKEAAEDVFPAGYKMDLVRKGSDAYVPWDLDVKNARVRLREPKSGRITFDFAARPMLGCVGVAAAGDFGPTSGISGPYGGNIDYNEIVEGATVMLPVFHRGGLLFLGDGHALQGDGEPVGTGIETSMDVTFTVTVKKNARLSMPRVENAEFLMSVGSQPEFVSSLDRALELATSDMVAWLTREYGVEPWAAHQLIGMIGRYDVVTVAGSMALRIPKKLLPK